MNDKNDTFLKKRFLELANSCYQKHMPVYCDFLNLNEQNIFMNINNQLPPVNHQFIGGSVSLDYIPERNMVKFTPIDYYGIDISPISYIKIIPTYTKYSENLTHRDYLGAILNLGISRNMIGDILVNENNTFIIVNTKMTSFIVDNLIKIKHTLVTCTVLEDIELEYEAKFQEIKGTVASLRLDSAIALAFNLSRGNVVKHIEEGFVFVNGKKITSNGYNIKLEDIVSLRKQGRFSIAEIGNVTRKGRLVITLKKYI